MAYPAILSHRRRHRRWDGLQHRHALTGDGRGEWRRDHIQGRRYPQPHAHTAACTCALIATLTAHAVLAASLAMSADPGSTQGPLAKEAKAWRELQPIDYDRAMAQLLDDLGAAPDPAGGIAVMLGVDQPVIRSIRLAELRKTFGVLFPGELAAINDSST